MQVLKFKFKNAVFPISSSNDATVNFKAWHNVYDSGTVAGMELKKMLRPSHRPNADGVSGVGSAIPVPSCTGQFTNRKSHGDRFVALSSERSYLLFFLFLLFDSMRPKFGFSCMAKLRTTF
jgi:hypothetical protein